MKVLVVGGGGREHALCWKLRKSPLLTRLFCAPGNAGIAGIADCVDIAQNDLDGLVRFAKEQSIDLTVVGPEEPLCQGIVDRFQAAGLRIFGPTKAAAEIEGSKAFARELCRRHRIPSPGSWTFEDMPQAFAFLDNRTEGPIVVKASGLAAGKGVTLSKSHEEAKVAVRAAMEQRRFGDAGRVVVLEETLVGEELSVMVLTDGKTIVPLEAARDHKAVFDGDKGPNTGGMGAYSPVPTLGHRTQRQIENQVLFPAIHAMNREERPFRGFLYAGLMLTSGGPRVLEFNCRLGDPETQPLLMRLRSDLLPLLLHAAEGTLDQLEAPQFDSRAAVCVVAASGGYPGDYKKGYVIRGLDGVAASDDVQVFHAGTERRGNEVLTSGGRVLSVTALGANLSEARTKAYAALEGIEFTGMQYRKDIGGRG
jgi:phosphoribosylamine--glycine ligase